MEYITIEILGTFTGCAAAVTALTQVAKHFIKRVDPKWIALLISFVISIGLFIASADLTVMKFILALCNALLVTGVAIGIFEGGVKAILSKLSSSKEETS